jgi:hypothetical protein
VLYERLLRAFHACPSLRARSFAGSAATALDSGQTHTSSDLMESFLFKDGTELLKEAQIKRFDLEKRGWQLEGQR